MLGYWLIVQVISGIATAGSTGGGVAFWAHIGGFVAGAALIFVFRDNALLARHPHYGWNKRNQDPYWRRIDRRR
jgi:membrane associated rhomboid family serine protease